MEKNIQLNPKGGPQNPNKKNKKNIESEQLQNNSGNPKKNCWAPRSKHFAPWQRDIQLTQPPATTIAPRWHHLVGLPSPLLPWWCWFWSTWSRRSERRKPWGYEVKMKQYGKDFMKISKIRMIIPWIPLILHYFGQKLGPWQTPHALDPAEPSACSSRCHSLAWPGGNPDVSLIKISIFGGPKMRLPPNYHPVMTFTVRHGKIHPSFYS